MVKKLKDENKISADTFIYGGHAYTIARHKNTHFIDEYQ